MTASCFIVFLPISVFYESRSSCILSATMAHGLSPLRQETHHLLIGRADPPSSKSTSSDKLSELPPQPSPAQASRSLRPQNRAFRRSLDTPGASVSAPEIRASSPGSPPAFPISHSVSLSMRQGESENSLGRETPSRQRVSFDSDRGSWPIPHQSRQCKRHTHMRSTSQSLTTLSIAPR